MTNWRQVKLEKLISIKHGYAFKGDDIITDDNGIVLVTPGNFAIGGGFQEEKCKFFKGQYPKDYVLKENDLIVTMTDLSKECDTLGYSALVPSGSRIYLHNQRIGLVEFKNNLVDKLFLYWFMRTKKYQHFVVSSCSGSVIKHTSPGRICDATISLPPIDVQKKIAGVLGTLDDKIVLNNKINNNLEQQAQALFKSWFVDKTNPNRKNIKVEEFFNISIGKTPPRKEPEWFSKNSNDVKWISISDMGNCGMYISDSSEYLIPSAISKFNVKIVPNNTVLLSFKLTVGRIAITDGKMTTNEAIAHFITDKTEINEYLYCYLKNFNFQTMGSTSSIATAVNSKIIKAMPFVVPEENELKDFHCAVAPMFSQIKFNQRENFRLAQLRDALLPKLMSGEIDVSKVDINEFNIV